MFNTVIVLVSLAAALVSAGAAVYAVRQVSRLRRSDEWRAVLSDIDKGKSNAKLLEQRVDSLEDDVGRLPTAADIARLGGAIERVESEVRGAAQGVDRIEGLLMKHAFELGARK